MEGQFLLVVMRQSVHHEDAIVNTNTEDKGGDDDADEVKADVKQYHSSQDDHPTEQDGQEAQQGMLEVEMETQEQDGKDKSHRQPLQHVEVLTHPQ